jgi:hypothetical protein
MREFYGSFMPFLWGGFYGVFMDACKKKFLCTWHFYVADLVRRHMLSLEEPAASGNRTRSQRKHTEQGLAAHYM